MKSNIYRSIGTILIAFGLTLIHLGLGIVFIGLIFLLGSYDDPGRNDPIS